MHPRIFAVMAAWILSLTVPAWADTADATGQPAAPEEAKAADAAPAAETPAEQPADATATPPADAAASEAAPATPDADDDDEAASEGGEQRFEELSFRDKYFSFSLPESASPQVQEEKMKFILISILAGFMLPFPELWLPLVMWDPKPEFDLGRMLVPWIIKTAIWLGGHAAMSACVIVPYLGWACFVLLLPVQAIWYGVNLWTERIMMLMIYDDIIKHPPEKKKKDAAAASAGTSLVAAPAEDVEDISGR